MVTGAVIVLAGAVLIGAGVIAQAVADAGNRFPTSGAGCTIAAGVFVAVIGLGIMATASIRPRR